MTKKILSVIISLTLLLSIFTVAVNSVNAETLTSGNFDYTVLDDGTIEINRYIGYENEIEIPSSIDGKTVTSIDEYAFYKCSSLKSVTISDSVKNINSYAFHSCKYLENVLIPNSVISIGYCAFQHCNSLINVTIGNSVTSIGYWAFDDTAIYNNESNWENGVLYIGNYLIDTNGNLSEKCIIKENTRLIADHAFESRNHLSNIIITESVISIGSWAFFGCSSLKELVIPNSVTSIGDKAFRYCTSLSSVTIPQSVLNIGNCIFEECQSNLIIYLKKDSYAETYVKENNIKYKYYCDDNEHVLITDSAVEPTCESIGLTAGSHCSVCGKILIQQSIIPQLNHSFINYFSDNNSTCTTNCTETAKCDTCNKTNTREIENTKLGHSYSNEWSIDKEATCTETGSLSKHCIRFNECKSSIDSIIIPAKGHKESEWEIILEATDTAQGIRRKTCLDCGKSLITEYYNKHTHTYISEITKVPTCIEKGIRTFTCSCGKSYTETIPTKAHSYKWIVTKKASYVSTGTKSYKCSVCGKVSKTTSIAKLKLKTPSFSVSAGKKLFKIKYTKVIGATGFQVKYTIGKKTVTKTFNTAKSVTKTISGLKKGSYKVQIRAFVKQGSKTAYSDWTKAKSVKVK